MILKLLLLFLRALQILIDRNIFAFSLTRSLPKLPIIVDNKLTIINGRSFPEDCLGEVRRPYGGRALPKIGKMRFGSCAKEVAFPTSVHRHIQ